MTSETLCTVVNGGDWHEDGSCTRTFECDQITDENAEWNGGNGSYTRTWNGSWGEPAVTEYGNGECGYKCVDEHHYENSQCISNTRPGAACGDKPEHTEWVNGDTFTQTWDGNGWTPENKVAEYGDGECGFSCVDGYFWNEEKDDEGVEIEPSCKKIIPLGKLCTGLTGCYNYGAEIKPCPAYGEDFYGQDAQNTGCVARKFTLYESRGIVFDHNTGLVWQHSPSRTTYDWSTADSACELLRNSNSGGFSDWRLPNTHEILTIANVNAFNPAIEPVFDVGLNVKLWTSKQYGNEDAYYFSTEGYLGEQSKSYPNKVLCVRGAELPAAVFNDEAVYENGEEVVVDSTTGLIWQKGLVNNKNWKDALAYCQSLNDSNYAGHINWRLPNRNELASILDHDKTSEPYSYFPEMPDGVELWSSSTVYSYSFGNAWYMRSSYGTLREDSKSDTIKKYVKCVRNDETQAEECVAAGGEWNETEEKCECTAEGYVWSGSACVLYVPTEEEICNAASGTNWNNGTCECTADGYFWDGESGSCVDPCESVQCTQNAVCAATSLTETSCNCVAGYFADGENCVNPCESAPCNSINNAVSDSCNAVDANTYSCECESGYDWNAGNLTCDATAETICMSEGGTNWDGSTCTRTQTCDPIPVENADWNGVPSYTQTYDFETGKWNPEYETEYSETAGECYFACVNGYSWNNGACEKTAATICGEAGGTWDGTHCTLDGFIVCSETSTTPCIDPETRLIWSSKATVTEENIVSKCENSTEGGYSDWQTATISQLRTLVSSCDAEALGLGGTCGVTDDCSESSCYDWNDCYADCTNLSKLGDDYYLTSSTPNEKYWSVAFEGSLFGTNAILDQLSTPIYIRCTRCAEGYGWNGTACVVSAEQEICENGGGNWTNGTCKCYSGYKWNGTACVKMTEEENCIAAGGTWDSATQTCKKRYLCSAKPANTEWNGWGVNEYEAPYPKPDGYVAPLTQYSEEWGDCTFVCADGYAWDWNDSICAVTASKCSEIGGSWNEALSACTKLADCGIYDPDHIVWNDGGRNGKFTQTTKNGTDWSPGTLQSTYSEEPGDCHITCEEDYYLFTLFWGDTQLDKCTNGCVNDPCADMAHSNHTCTPTGATTYTCGCDNGYVWTGTSCDSIQLCSPSSTYPCFDSETGLLWSSKTTGVADADVVSHCEISTEGEYNDWETPTISQLRSLVTNCAKLELGGACGVTDYCTSSSCYVSNDCRNLQCNGQLSKTGDTELVSSNLSSNNVFWEIYLTSGSSSIMAPTDKSSYDVRCSRCYFDDQRWNPLLSKCSSINNPEKAECAPLTVANAVWNDNGNNGKVDQAWDGDSWEPTTIPQTTYSTTPGTCHYKCKTNYVWKDGSCVFVKDNLCNRIDNVFPCYFESTLSGQPMENILSEEFPAMNYSDAVNYCNTLKNYGDVSASVSWELPFIDDLRALVRDCNETEPGGRCGVTHSCSTSHSSSSCYDIDKCSGCGISTYHNFYTANPQNNILWSQDLLPQVGPYVLDFYSASIYGIQYPHLYSYQVRCIARVRGLNLNR